MVHQHFMLAPSLTVAENLVLGVEPVKGGFFSISDAIRITDEMSEKYNMKVDGTALVEDIPVGLKQKTEIMKALLRGAKILILDEPTAVLTPQEAEELFAELRHLKETGHTIIFISHKLNEIKKISDRVTVMRNGKKIDVLNTREVTERDISRLIIGHDISSAIEKRKACPGGNMLKVENVTYINDLGKMSVKDVSFVVRRGEILGVAGVEGNGQRELVECITGHKHYQSGSIKLKEKEIKDLGGIENIRGQGMSYIPEDRMLYGCAKDMDIIHNIMSLNYATPRFAGKLLLKNEAIKNYCGEASTKFKVKCKSIYQKVCMLSGGNIQKVVVAREMSAEADLLIAEQPTRGIDVGSARFIHEKLIEQRDSGCAILLVSADFNEVLAISDSLIVMYNGNIVAYFEDASSLNANELGLYMLGIKKQSTEELTEAVHA
jgi:simple sugar transport system ATP-binding protein